MATPLHSLSVRLIGSPARPSLRAACWLALGLGLATLTASSWRFLHDRTTTYNAGALLPLVLGLAITASPPLVALVAALLTARRLGDGNHELLTVTTLPNMTIVHGYVFSALYQARLILALTLGVIPAAAIEMVTSATQAAIFFCQMELSHYWDPDHYNLSTDCKLPTVEAGVIWLLVVSGVWGLNLLAAAAGVGLTLWWRNAAAVITAPLGMFLLSFGSLWHWLMPLAINKIGLSLWMLQLTMNLPAKGGAGLLFMIAPYLLALCLMCLAYRWARKP